MINVLIVISVLLSRFASETEVTKTTNSRGRTVFVRFKIREILTEMSFVTEVYYFAIFKLLSFVMVIFYFIYAVSHDSSGIEKPFTNRERIGFPES